MMLAENVVELSISSQLEFIDLVTTLTDNITQMIGLDEEGAYWVNMAVRESVANAVEHGNKYDPQKTVDIRFTIGVDALRVSVRDHGEGIEESKIPDLLQPFVRGESARTTQGSGLGLAIVARIVKMHKGTLDIRNHPEGGLEISVSLPLPKTA